MCGFLMSVNTPWRRSVASALETLRSRGPDLLNTRDIGPLTLGHSRLSVIDLEQGTQPMSRGALHVVYNGEIYNFQELRRDLEADGAVFATRSDTEVLLALWERHGKQCLPLLDGMFAFAIWDEAAGRVYLARDKMGVKPCFYSTLHGLTAASTLAPFFALEGFPRKLDFEALRDYLAFQTCLAPHSFLQDVKQLPPASLLEYEIQTQTASETRYWHIPAQGGAVVERAELVERLDHALRESVKRQMVADVPLGAFLSGGIDSSLLVSYLSERVSGPLKTYSLRFPEASVDESEFAQEVATRFGCEHHIIDAPKVDAAYLMRTIAALDEPLADPAYVMTFALSEQARRGVTVCVSGDGGDELFCGYPRFLDHESRYPRRAHHSLLRFLVNRRMIPGAMLRRSLYGQEYLHYKRVELGPWSRGRKNMLQYLKEPAREQLKVDRTLGLWRDLVDELSGSMDTSTLMRADLWTYLSENCLTKSDRASMAHGLELRVPLLGNGLLDLALEQPAAVHTQNGLKSLLTTLARQRLPECVWNRPNTALACRFVAYFGVHGVSCVRKVWLRSKKWHLSWMLQQYGASGSKPRLVRAPFVWPTPSSSFCYG